MDMFPSTHSAKNAVDMFPRTGKSNDINAINSSHVECCVLLYKKEYYEKEVKGQVTAEVVTEV